MRFFHLGDLHFGKFVHDKNMADPGGDQEYWIDRLLEKVDEYKPDAVVVAGDVYDRKVPSTDAMKLFDKFVTGLSARDVYVFIVPGNHDSDIRLSHVNKLLEEKKIYIAGELQKELMHVTVYDDGTADSGDDTKKSGVTFWFMPYIFPKLVADKRVLNQDDLSTYDDACRALLAAQPLDKGTCNVLIAHQNVIAHGTASDHSGSESIIGGLGEIDYTAFDAFDYVALGHIHNAQKVGRDTVRYSGCPLYYDFSEVGRKKDLLMVDIVENEISITELPMPLRHKLINVQGSLEEVLEAGKKMKDKEMFYIQAIIEDRHIPSHAMEQLRDVFGVNLMHVKRVHKEEGEAFHRGFSNSGAGEGAEVLSIGDQFNQFFEDQHEGEELNDMQGQVIYKIIEQQENDGGDYITDYRNIPEAAVKELIELLVGKEGDEE